jgi:hypothetical protein
MGRVAFCTVLALAWAASPAGVAAAPFRAGSWPPIIVQSIQPLPTWP